MSGVFLHEFVKICDVGALGRVFEIGIEMILIIVGGDGGEAGFD